MGKFLDFQETAAALIGEFGSTVTFTRDTESAFDPVTGVATKTPLTVTYTAVVMPAGTNASFKVGSLEGRVVVEIYVALLGKPYPPKPGDVAQIGAVPHKVIWAQTYEPALDGPIFTLCYAEA